MPGWKKDAEAIREMAMGYIPSTLPIKLNLDRFGMPKDYATYVYLLYKKIVADESPARLAFLHKDMTEPSLYFGFILQYDMW